MQPFLERTALLLGEKNIEKLQGARVALLGLGGVGSAAAEALCRVGVGHLLLVDHDVVSPSNLNRQLLATCETVGQAKVEAARKRLLSINPALDLMGENAFYLPEQSDFVYEYRPDVVLDAIDTVTAKLHLAAECQRREIPLVSCLGTGNRLDPSQLRLGDLAETAGTGCPLARVMRRELRRRGVTALKVVFSLEPPRIGLCAGSENGRHSPASAAFVPPAAGMLLAYAAVQAICAEQTVVSNTLGEDS